MERQETWSFEMPFDTTCGPSFGRRIGERVREVIRQIPLSFRKGARG